MRFETVFDLRTSPVFFGAASLAGPLRPWAERIGRVHEPQLDSGWGSVPIVDLPAGQVTVFRDITGVGGQQIADTLGVETVAQLATWPPYLAALELLTEAMDRPMASAEDAAADELVPGFGRDAIQQLTYQRLVAPLPPAADMVALDSSADVAKLLDQRPNGTVANAPDKLAMRSRSRAPRLGCNYSTFNVSATEGESDAARLV